MPIRQDPILGLDMGGVVTNEPALDLNLEPGVRRKSGVLYIPGAVQRIRAYTHEQRFAEIVFLSRASILEEHALRDMLHVDGFWEKTYLRPSLLHCCESSSGKVPLARYFGVTHYVDNLYRTLRQMINTVDNLFLFCPDERDKEDYHKNPTSIQLIESWGELDHALRQSLRSYNPITRRKKSKFQK